MLTYTITVLDSWTVVVSVNSVNTYWVNLVYSLERHYEKYCVCHVLHALGILRVRTVAGMGYIDVEFCVCFRFDVVPSVL